MLALFKAPARAMEELESFERLGAAWLLLVDPVLPRQYEQDIRQLVSFTLHP